MNDEMRPPTARFRAAPAEINHGDLNYRFNTKQNLVSAIFHRPFT